MKILLSIATLAAMAFAQGPDSCKVVGQVISVKAETKAQPAADQFRIAVSESPWNYQPGVSLPITRIAGASVAVGDLVEITCDPRRPTKHGRLVGSVQKSAAPPVSN